MPGDMSENIITGLKKAAAPNMVIGKPVTVQGVILMPVISITTAYGGSSNHAGGGFFKLDPVAIVVLREEEINVYTLKQDKSAEKLAVLLPEILEREQDDTY